MTVNTQKPKHGDEAVCKKCGKRARYWDGNPNHLGAHWFHPGPTFEVDGLGSRYCDTTTVEVQWA